MIKKNIAVSESGFVFDPSSGDSYSLNSIGLEILTLIRDGQNLTEITRVITDKYDVDPIVFEQYYLDFVAQLRHYHILTEDDEN